MNKRKNIIYWIVTGWLSLGMISTAIVQLIGMDEELENFLRLGYPKYVMTIMGVWKILGVIAILLPKWPLVKEWAYAGFFFAMSGALISHFVVGDDGSTFFGPCLLLILTILSWYLRPPNRKL